MFFFLNCFVTIVETLKDNPPATLLSPLSTTWWKRVQAERPPKTKTICRDFNPECPQDGFPTQWTMKNPWILSAITGFPDQKPHFDRRSQCSSGLPGHRPWWLGSSMGDFGQRKKRKRNSKGMACCLLAGHDVGMLLSLFEVATICN